MKWWRRQKKEQDLDRELRAHLDLEAEERRDSGFRPDDARYAAQRNLGNTLRLKETVCEVWGWTWVEQIAQDLIYAVRLLRKSPGFSAVAILSLTLGIGANTAIFGLIDALVFKSLPVRDPRSLLFLAKQTQRGLDTAFYYETYARLSSGQPFLQELAAYTDQIRMNVIVNGDPEPVMGQLVSGNYFDVLGVPPAAGRVLTSQDDRLPGDHPVAVISDAYWERRFGRAEDAFGRRVLIDGTPFTIVGVTPPGFNGLQIGDAPEISVPIMMQPQMMPDKKNWLGRSRNTVDWLNIFGRLKPGITQVRATSGLQVMFQNIQTQLAAEIGLDKATWRKEWVETKLVLTPGGSGLSSLFGALAALLAAIGLYGVVAYSVGRRAQEIGVRMALGALPGRVLRLVLRETLSLGVLGILYGLPVALAASRLLVGFLYGVKPGDPAVLLASAGFLVTIAAIAGVIPARRASRIDPVIALRDE